MARKRSSKNKKNEVASKRILNTSEEETDLEHRLS